MSTVSVQWEYKKNDETYCDVRVTLEGSLSIDGEQLPASAIEAILGKAGRIVSDPNGKETKTHAQCKSTWANTLKGLREETRGTGGFGESLSSVFKVQRDIFCKAEGLKKGFAKRVPSEDALRALMGAEAYETQRKALLGAGLSG